MTAYGTPEVAHGALALGAHAVLNKPLDLTQIAAIVRQAGAAPSTAWADDALPPPVVLDRRPIDDSR
jgi:hypothetical protein